jgi:hypothetical protein
VAVGERFPWSALIFLIMFLILILPVGVGMRTEKKMIKNKIKKKTCRRAGLYSTVQSVTES